MLPSSAIFSVVVRIVMFGILLIVKVKFISIPEPRVSLTHFHMFVYGFIQSNSCYIKTTTPVHNPAFISLMQFLELLSILP